MTVEVAHTAYSIHSEVHLHHIASEKKKKAIAIGTSQQGIGTHFFLYKAAANVSIPHRQKEGEPKG